MKRREFSRFELNDLANGIHYALKDPEVQQINFTREQAEIALFALETADAALKMLDRVDARLATDGTTERQTQPRETSNPNPSRKEN